MLKYIMVALLVPIIFRFQDVEKVLPVTMTYQTIES